MRLTRLQIQNFRSIKDLDIELGETTVFIGPNNAGKTAILDAIRIALTRKWGQRGTGFTEYDIHLATETVDPKASPGIVIELKAEELHAGEWPDALQQDLDDIIQTDPTTGRAFITVQASCAWSAADASFQPAWVFLNAARAPLINRTRRGWQKAEPLDDKIEKESPSLVPKSIIMLVEENVRRKEQILLDSCLSASDLEEITCMPFGYFRQQAAPVVPMPKHRTFISSSDGSSSGVVVPFGKVGPN